MDFLKDQVKLLEKKKPFIVLQNVKDRYPAIPSQSVMLSKIKRMYLNERKHRVPEYKIEIEKLEKKYPNNEHLNDFKKRIPYEQDKIQKQILNGKVVYTKEIDDVIVDIPIVDNEVIKHIRLIGKDAKDLRREQRNALNEKHYNTREIDGQELMDKLLPELNSDNPKPLICALLLATGRRQNELVKGNIEESSNGPYFAVFSGQSKTGLDLKRDSYDIPLLAPFSKVKRAWNLSAKYFKDGNKTFKAKIRNVDRWLKKHPEYNIENLHEFRSVYALIAFQLFPTGRLSQMAYISSVLGETSINVASHYNSIQIKNVQNIWVPAEMKHNWVFNDKHTEEVAKKLNEYIITGKKKITKALLRNISGKSQGVVKRFYDNNKTIIETINR